ncbi:MAG: hypothetical protein ACYTGC_09220 [Planctomycetota bacterium]|jgi:flagellar motility protein MotE (MotC chaperone)
MRTLWNMLSFMAVVNLLALLMFGGWLWRSGRLDRERLLQVRDLLGPTIVEAEARVEQIALAASQQEAAAREAARRADPPLASDAHVRQISRDLEQERLAHQHVLDARARAEQQLRELLDRIEEGEARLRAQQDQWETRRTDGERQTADEQFARVVKQLETIPSKQAKGILLELIRTDRIDQAVRYLDAMSQRKAAKVISEFKTPEETRLATELLELQGAPDQVTGPEDSPHAPDAASSG